MKSFQNAMIQMLYTLVFAMAAIQPASAEQARELKLEPARVEDIVKRSYQYVAMYNVINKAALAPVSNPMGTGGWNKLKHNTKLFDASVTSIARPNNDSLYQIIILDLRDDAMIIEVPAFDSTYVSLETSAYDHYCEIPISTRQGDFKKPQRLLFYTARTRGYQKGTAVRGIDRYLEMSGDFVIANFRVMPHANDPARFKRIVGQIGLLKAMTLSAHQGKKAAPISKVSFPSVGKTDADVFGTNLLEVMQFIINHTTFDSHDRLDQALLAAYRPLGIEPDKAWDPAKAFKIDGAMFRKVSEEVAKNNSAIMADSARVAVFIRRLFQPKGKTDLDSLVFQSVIGPIGQPVTEALYPPVNTADGKPMNALHDYVIMMTKEELPPSKAFWSLTLYDTKNGFFIPNKQNKYSVGENAGYRLNADGGIDVHIAAEKPAGVPDENWLPINRADEGISIILRVYVPDLEKMKTWKAPRAVLMK